MKTNAMRVLDREEIAYEVVEFKVGKDHMDGVSVAKAVSRPVETVFKTLVLYDKSDLFVCLVPVNEHIDLKKLAQASGRKSLSLLPLNELTTKTGYQRGGCSPIGMKKHYPTFMHESCLDHDTISVSGGHRSCQIILNPTELINLLDIKIGDYVQADMNLIV